MEAAATAPEEHDIAHEQGWILRFSIPPSECEKKSVKTEIEKVLRLRSIGIKVYTIQRVGFDGSNLQYTIRCWNVGGVSAGNVVRKLHSYVFCFEFCFLLISKQSNSRLSGRESPVE